MPISAPTDISGCVAWFDASDAGSFTFSSGNVVSQWNDKASTPHHATQATVANQPTRSGTQNGLATVVFDGSNDSIGSATWTWPPKNPFTFFVVFKPTGNNSERAVVSSDSGNALLQTYNTGPPYQYTFWVAGDYAANHTTPMTTLATGSWHHANHRANGSSSIQRIDEVTVSTDDPGGGGDSNSGLIRVILGAVNWGGFNFTGEIAEFFAYDSILTGTQVTDAEAYIISKWGISAPPASRITFGAVGVKAGTGTTTVSVAHPAGTAANQVLLAGRCAWEPTVSFTNETGWTASGSLSGGTGTATDAHQTAIRVDRKEISGADAGPTVFDQTVSAQAGVAAVMASYTKASSTATWAYATATGDAATHAANRSVTSSTSLGLSVGDIVTAWAAVDTDVALTISANSITATNVTFGATTRRTSGVGSGTGDDGNIEMFDAEVTALSSGTEQTQAVTLAFTTATTTCGPVGFVRLRSVPLNTDGTAVGSLAIAGTASGSPAGPGGGTGFGAGSLTLAGVAAGAVAHTATAVGTFTVSGAATDGAAPGGGAVVATHRVTGTLGSNSGGQTWTGATSSFAVVAGEAVIVFVGATDEGVATADFRTCTAVGYSFTKPVFADQATTFTGGLTAFVAIAPSTNATQTVTIGTGLVETFELHYSVYTVAGIDTADPVGAVASATENWGGVTTLDGSRTITLDAAPATNSTTVAAIYLDASAGDTTKAVAPGSGWTEDAELPGSGSLEGFLQVQQRAGSTSTSVDWADVNVNAATTIFYSLAAVAVEMRAGAAAADVTGAGVATLTLAGVSAGTRGTAGTAAGSLALTGVAVGLGTPLGVGAGSLTLSAVAAGAVAHTATAAGSLTVTGAVVVAAFVGRRPAVISGRKVLDQEGDVHLMRTFSSWTMANHLSNAEITQALQDVAANGFNGVTVWMGGTLSLGSTWHKYTNDAGQNFWTGTPWASGLGAAWTTVDHLIAEAGSLGITVHFSLCGGFTGQNGCRAEWVAATNTNMQQAGFDIATRYLNAENIVWHVMFDNGDTPDQTSGQRVQAFFTGVNNAEGATTRPVRWMESNLLSTAESNGWLGVGAFNVTINAAYDYAMNSAEIAESIWAVIAVPVGDSEPPYDGANHFTGNMGQQLRERSYSVFLEGGCLINYGHEDWWSFGVTEGLSYTEGFDWFEVPDDPHTIQQSYCWALLDRYVADATWVPSGWVTTGEGSGDTKAAAGNSNTAALAYFPSSRTVAVNTTVIAGTDPVTLRWFDPTNNTFTNIATAEAQQTGRSVTYPSAHGDGTNDWVLVVTAAATGTAVGSLAIGGAAAGVRATAGSGAGSVSISGTVSGIGTVSGAAVGSLALTGAAAGVRQQTGATAAGSLALTGVATGIRTTAGSAVVGSLTLSGAAAGVPNVAATAVGALGLSGVAAGVPGVTATADGGLVFGATAIGQTAGAAAGFGAGSLTVDGVASGVRSTTGTAAGSLAVAGVAAGAVTGNVTGTAAGTLAVAGVAAGVPDVAATAIGVVVFGASAAGNVAHTATATGSVAFAATAIGLPEGAAAGFGAGDLTLAATASGTRGIEAQAGGMLALGGSAAGEALAPSMGAAAGTLVFGATAAATVDVEGSAQGSLTIVGRVGTDITGLTADVVYVVREKPRYFIVKE